MNALSQRSFQLLLLAVVLLNATGLCNDIMEPDGALYAAIAKHIAITGDWINLYGDGHDWLDKPHLPFWLAALSFKCLGVTAFAYKLPAFLCWLAGLYYTYQLALRLYNRAAAQLSVIIYGTALHVVLANFDVRAEAYLTTFVVAAIYYLHGAESEKYRWRQLLTGAFFCALSVMTKGVFTLITITGGLVIYQLITRRWKWFLLYWWLVAIAIAVFILPEIYCLYRQFDSHPEKVVFGHTQVSGIRFFFWDSQFGRFFNSGPIRGEGDPFFFLHTVLWAFLPWSVFLYTAVVQTLRRKAVFLHQHWVTAGSAFISFLLFSLSKFQLPHYIVIVFPQLAMFTAGWLVNLTIERSLRKAGVVQVVLLCAGGVLLLVLALISNIGYLPVQLVWMIAAVLLSILLFTRPAITAIAARGTGFALLLFVFLNLLFYPGLLQYQGGMQAGKYLQQHAPGARPVMFQCNVYSFEFYAPSLVARAADSAALYTICAAAQAPVYVLAPAEAVNSAQHSLLQVQLLQSFHNFHVSQLTGGFLNPQTRSQQLNTYCLLRVSVAR